MAKQSKFKKFIAVGCSHGHKSDPAILEEVCSFADKFKADARIHLGDWADFAALRSGARGSNDEAENIVEDLTAGFKFLSAYKATHIFWGNHERRIFRHLHSSNAINSYAASRLLGEFQDFAQAMKAQVFQYYGIADNRSCLKLGDTLFLHGWMYGENATRDHAEWAGCSVVHAHTHRPQATPGRCKDDIMGYCVGTLADIPAMDYADSRRATSAWGPGVVFGEYNERETYICLVKAKNGKFRFPI